MDALRLHEELAGQELDGGHLPGLLHLGLSRGTSQNSSTVKGTFYLSDWHSNGRVIFNTIFSSN